MEFLDVLRLFGGFVYLVLGGDLLVRGALGLSRRTSISPVIVGLTVVAFGTSAPELVISVYATAAGFTGVALGNVVGSNIANVLLVLGVPAMIRPIVADAAALVKHSVFMVLVSVVLIAMAWNGVLSRIEGIVLFGGLVGLLWFVYRAGVELPGVDTPDEEDQYERVLGMPSKVPVAVMFIVLGIVLLPVGADLTVEGATAIARALDIPEVVIGSTVVALGTSLPELTTTVIAAFHRSSDIALGNVIGSNVFNILLVGGASAMVAPLPIPPEFAAFDLWVMLAVALLVCGYIFLHRPIGRLSGGVFFAAYLAYIAWVI